MSKYRLVFLSIGIFSALASAIETSERALVVVTHLSEGGPIQYRSLYQFAETAGGQITKSGLRRKYRSVTEISGNDATTANLVEALQALTDIQEVRAIDLFTHVHGDSDGAIYLKDAAVSSSELQNLVLPFRQKLRLYYTTSCFGSAHTGAMRAAGFQSAIGSRGGNANGAWEYPIFVERWASGATLGQILSIVNNSFINGVFDSIAIRAGLDGTDSEKLLEGSGELTIDGD